MKNSRLAMAMAAWLVLAALPAYAGEALGLVTGPKTGTYFAFGKDIAGIATAAGVEVDVRTSEGSIDNLKRLNGKDRAALAIMQSDVLGFLSRSKNPDSMRLASGLRLVFPFYNEEVHVLARKSIKSFSDLKGKKIAIGEEGSGSMLTAINLLAMMGVEPQEMQKIAPALGVTAVLKGELDAAVVVAGKPVRLFKNLEALASQDNKEYAPLMAEVHFLPLDNPKMLEEYKPAVITKSDYSYAAEDVKTIATQAVLVSQEESRNGKRQRCAAIAALAKSIRVHLAKLQATGHPKWKEVNLDSASGLWQKDVCAWPELSDAAAENLSRDLIEQIENKP